MPQKLAGATAIIAFAPALNEDGFKHLHRTLLNATVYGTEGVPKVTGTIITLNPFTGYSLQNVIFIPNDILVFVFSANNFDDYQPLLKAVASADNTGIFYPVKNEDGDIIGISRDIIIDKKEVKEAGKKRNQIPPLQDIIQSVDRQRNDGPNVDEVESDNPAGEVFEDQERVKSRRELEGKLKNLEHKSKEENPASNSPLYRKKEVIDID